MHRLFVILLACLRKVAIGEHHGCHKTPAIDEDTQPAGDDLNPHGCLIAIEELNVRVGFVPVGQGHHDVEGS